MKIPILLLIILISFTSNNLCFAQWKQTNGPNGGFINCLINSDNNLFAGTNKGIFVTSNNGLSWISSNEGLPETNITSFSKINSYLFAATSSDGVFISSNGGQTWEEVNTASIGSNVTSLITIGDTLYAGTSYSIFFSPDLGANWTKTSLSQCDIFALASCKNALITSYSEYIILSPDKYLGKTKDKFKNYLPNSSLLNYGGIDSPGYGIFCSLDNGNHWEYSGKDYIVNSFAVNDSIVIAGYDGGIIMSDNLGLSWVEIGNDLSNKNINSVAISDGKIYAGTDNSIYISRNMGKEWAEFNNKFPSISVQAILVQDSLIFAGTGGYISDGWGVYCYTENSGQWMATNMVNSFVYTSTFYKDILIAGTRYNGIFLSADGGDNWVLSNDIPGSVNTIFEKDNYLFAGISSGAYTSPDSGKTWLSINTGLTGSVESVAVIDSLLYIAIHEGVFRSNIYNIEWQLVLSGSAQALAVNETNCIYAGVKNNIYRSDDFGMHWLLIDSALSGASVSSIAVKDNYVFASSYGKDLLISDNYGDNWSVSDIDNSSIRQFGFVGDYIFAATSKGIYLSEDKGQNWKPVNEGFTDKNIFSLSIYDNFIYTSVWGHGIWKRALGQMITNILDKNATDPINFELFQNYPNPFNSKTKIKFNILETAKVTLTIIDLLGRRVEILLDKNMEKGTHEFVWNAARFSSGIYFYNIKSENINETKKLILIK